MHVHLLLIHAIQCPKQGTYSKISEVRLLGRKAISSSHGELANSLDSKKLTSLISTKLYLLSNVFTIIM
jgi:hypothetical protein